MKTKLKVMRIVIIILSLLLAGGASYLGVTFFTSRVDTYEIEFVTYTNQDLSALQVQKNKTIKHIDSPTREGYTFNGWYLDQQLTEKFDKEHHLITENLKLYASWQMNKYFLLFETNGGTAISSYQIYEGEIISQIDKVTTREGYSFGGWYIDNALETPLTSLTVKGHATLYAKWNPGQSLVTYNSAGGNFIEPEYIVSDSIVEQLPIPERDGYNFLGWYVDNNLEKLYLDNVLIDDNYQFTARWEPMKYQITFKTNLNFLTINPISLNYLDQIIIKAPLVEGYTFTGWYHDRGYKNPLAKDEQIEEDLILYGKWEETSHLISFESNGGEAILPIYVVDGEKIGDLGIPIKTGHAFNGWYIDGTLLNLFDIETNIKQSYTLYAKWERAKYLITFETNLTNLTKDSIYLDYSADIIVDPLYDNDKSYTFLGWYLDSDFNIPLEKGYIIQNDLTLYAKWDRNRYLVKFDPQGGEEMPAKMVFDGEIIGDVTAPTKIGHEFLGWYIDPAFSLQFNLETPIKQAYILYAKWQINKYTIDFESNGGTKYNSINEDYNQTFELPTPIKAGHSFLGWYQDSELNNQFETNKIPEYNLTLYAKWEINRYSITFITDGATPIPETVYLNYGEIYKANQPGSTKDGYKFVGWYLDLEDESSKWNFEEPYIIKGNIILYLKLTPDEYFIEYYLDETTYFKIEVFKFQEKLTHPTPSKEGHSFIGWYYDDNLLELENMPDHKLKLTAKWELNHYKISFPNANLLDLDYKFQDSIELPSSPIRDGFQFVGWYLDTKLTKVFNYEKMPSQDLLVYVKWGIKNKAIGFESNGGSYVESLIGETGDLVLEPEAPIKEGYSFVGWYSDPGLINEYNFTTIPEQGLVLYAKWEAKQYTISFKHDSPGYVVDPWVLSYGEEIPSLTIPSKDGHVFAGWYLEQQYINRFDLLYMPANNFTLYAKWEFDVIKIAFEIEYQIPTIIGVFGEKIIAPTAPTKEGYTFAGWYTDVQLTNEFVFTTMPNYHLYLYAKWDINNYSLSFETDDTDPIDSISFEYQEKIIFDLEPEKKGYTFVGWYLDEKLQHHFNLMIMPAFDLVLYAKWEINQYQITFIDENQVVIELDYNSLIEYQPNPKEGYSFAGWYIDELRLYIGPERVPAVEVTLYAKWKINQYTITFQSNGGTEIGSETGEYNKLFIPPNPNKTGYKFIGWYEDNNLTIKYEATRIQARDITLYAKWEINQYLLSFVTDGLTLLDEIYDYNSQIELPIIEKTGYSFIGWFSNVERTIEFDYVTMPNHDVRAFAKWQINHYSIAFESNGGTTINTITGEYYSKIFEPTQPTKIGHTFKGWFSDENLENLFIFNTIPAENLTLYAKWETNEYTIAFNSISGTSVASIREKYNTPISEPEEPTRLGYTFAGWFTEATYNNEFVFDYMPDENITLYAKWELIIYTIKFETDGGTNVDDMKKAYNSNITAPITTKAGYKFEGWFSDENLTESYIFAKMPAENITLYAKWKIETYTITFSSSFGSSPNQNYSYNEYVESLPAPKEYGYIFLGWFTENDQKFEILSTDSYQITHNINLTAKWEKGSFTISFDSKGGTQIADINKLFKEPVSAPTKPVKEKYQFVAWFTNEELTDTYYFSSMSGENIRLYAKWQRIEPITITYIRNDGEIDDIITYETTEIDNQIDYLEIFKKGHSFKGWFLEEEAINLPPVNLPDYDLIVYAKWEINSYDIKFITDGPAIANISYKYESIISPLPAIPAVPRTGYTFKGWYEDNEYQTEFSLTNMPDSDVNVYLKWEINQYTIDFVSNEGSSVESITQDYDSTIKAPTAPTKTGYAFKGWFIDESLTKAFSFKKMPAENITLYAKWEIKQFTITFDLEGGIGVLSIKQVYNTVVMEPVAPTRSGYEFIGWYKNKARTQPYVFGVITKNEIVYAKWEAKQFSIEFNSNGGTSVGSIHQDVDTPIVEPTNPTKLGYSFVGWFYNDTKYIFSNMEPKDITLEAKWNQIPLLEFVSLSKNYYLLENEAVVLRIKANDDDLEKVIMKFIVSNKTYQIELLPSLDNPLSTTLTGFEVSFDQDNLEWLVTLTGEAIANYFADAPVKLKVEIKDEFNSPFTVIERNYNFAINKAPEIISTTPTGIINVSTDVNFKYEIEIKGDDLLSIKLDTNLFGIISAVADSNNPYGSLVNQQRLNSKGISLEYDFDQTTKIAKLTVLFDDEATYLLTNQTEFEITALVEDLNGNIVTVTTTYQVIYN